MVLEIHTSLSKFHFELMRPIPENLLQKLPAKKCSLGCPILNRFLAGGLPCNSITELVSESSCGKTQISLQLLLSAQLPISLGGLSSSSLYFHSEYPFPLRRLHQLSLSFRSSHPNQPDPRDHIFVRPVQTAEEFLSVLLRLEPFIENPPSKLPVRVIVIDSIAALFRSEFENKASDLKKRSGLFFKIAAKLKFYANKFNLVVLVTNQVVDLVGDDGVNGLKVGNLSSFYTSGRRVCPALGLAWAHCVNSRFFLSRSNGIVCRGEDSVSVTRRRLQVVFAPHLPESSCEFVVTGEGVFGVNS